MRDLDKRQGSCERRDKRQGNYVSTRKRKKQGESMTIVASDENNKNKDKENEVVRMVTISDRNITPLLYRSSQIREGD